MLKFKKMGSDKVPLLLVTANVGSIFEDPSVMLPIWTSEFLQAVSRMDPKFIALHLQEVGGKAYEKSMQYVKDFVQRLCDCPELRLFDKIRIFLDEDFSSPEKFTALGNMYFAHSSLSELKIWDFELNHYVDVVGREVNSGNIEQVTTKEKAKFPQNFFPECKWSRKGFLRTRWLIRGTAVEFVNIHLFHDASNLLAVEPYPSVQPSSSSTYTCSTTPPTYWPWSLTPRSVPSTVRFTNDDHWLVQGTAVEFVNIHLFHDATNLLAVEPYPSVYCRSRRRALRHTLKHLHSDVYCRSRRRALRHTLKHLHSDVNAAPYFIFGDFNFRTDTGGVVKKLTEELTACRLQNGANVDSSKLQYKSESDDRLVLTIGKKEFNHQQHQKLFREPWLQRFDRELEALKPHLYEYPVKFAPTYPFEEDVQLPTHFMKTRCPAWCDRILLSQTARLLIQQQEPCRPNESRHFHTSRGIPACIIQVIRSLYEGSTCRVVHEKELGAPIRISAGVKQGCLLSPLLFVILLDDVMRNVVAIPRGISWHSGVLEDLDYADDIVLISPTLDLLQEKLVHLQEEARVGRKTVDMRIKAKTSDALILDNQRLDSVDTFTYLGSTVTRQGGADEDIESRIKKAKAAFAQLKPVWDSNVLTRRIKISLFDSIVKSVLLFGCETWRVTKGLTNKLQVFVNKSLRSILRVFWPKTIRNEDLWKLCRQSPIGKEIAKRKWRWIGHTVRRGATNAANVAFDWRPPNGKRSRGRPVQTWRRSVENELRAAGLSWSEAKSTAEDRRKWRTKSVADSTDSSGRASSSDSSPARSQSPARQNQGSPAKTLEKKSSVAEIDALSVPGINVSRKSIADPTSIQHAMNSRSEQEGASVRRKLVRNQSEGSPKPEPSELRRLVEAPRRRADYGVIGEGTCMGDHKPVYLRVMLQSDRGTVHCCTSKLLCPFCSKALPSSLPLLPNRLTRLPTDPDIYANKKFHSQHIDHLCAKNFDTGHSEKLLENKIKRSRTGSLNEMRIPFVEITTAGCSDHDIFVNDIDTSLLTAKPCLDPYTPESVDSHTPNVEAGSTGSDDLAAEIADIVGESILETKPMLKLTRDRSVSPTQLKSRLDMLLDESKKTKEVPELERLNSRESCNYRQEFHTESSPKQPKPEESEVVHPEIVTESPTSRFIHFPDDSPSQVFKESDI
ncbi:unnamed protein product [Plutella xylostella]|uniref:inositol-polyphosphate 5-phosphatase n=1 Tax=Plutella xylostella TaxID=51655 RepID=A0A8S4GDT2_PLUXY|nr:unnamed protein product [Plutella xylostella]